MPFSAQQFPNAMRFFSEIVVLGAGPTIWNTVHKDGGRGVATNMRATRRVNRPSNGDSDPRPTVHGARWLTIAFVISVAAMVAGGGVFLWAVYHESPSPGAVSVGATLSCSAFRPSWCALACGWRAADIAEVGPGHEVGYEDLPSSRDGSDARAEEDDWPEYLMAVQGDS